ncbi:MAG TPA: nucleoside-diphosphate kinase [Armatimonadetes bacterium]|nr:nucleoside-diphosphate kinase [Armatimonadota bacterium]
MERTLAILKPDCVRKQLIGQVLDRIERAGFRILALRMTWLTREQAEAFYAVHRERDFYPDLVEFMTSGPCVVMALEKENAVADFRALIGATDPAEAAEGTIRHQFADSKQCNIVHGSDTVENGQKEVAFFFGEGEIVRNRVGVM